MSTPAPDLGRLAADVDAEMRALHARVAEAEAIAEFNQKRVAEIDAYCRGWMQRALEAEAEIGKLKGRLN